MYSSGPSLAAPRHLSHAMTAVNHLFTFRGTGSLFFSVRPGLQIFEGPNTKKEGCEQEHGMERSENFKLGLERKKTRFEGSFIMSIPKGILPGLGRESVLLISFSHNLIVSASGTLGCP